jgi:environmental stress-induced protein Ves
MSKPSSIVRVPDLAAKKWRNGAGQTRELDVFPEEGGYEDFIWRVSIADVERDGPFSAYPGIDRTLVLLDGAGMSLRMAKSGALRHSLDEQYVPFEFSGDERIDATLINGIVRDFNLMVRRGLARGSIAVWHGPAAFAIPDATRLVFVAQGGATLNKGGAQQESLLAENAVRLRGEDYSIKLAQKSIVLAVAVHY